MSYAPHAANPHRKPPPTHATSASPSRAAKVTRLHSNSRHLYQPRRGCLVQQQSLQRTMPSLVTTTSLRCPEMCWVLSSPRGLMVLWPIAPLLLDMLEGGPTCTESTVANQWSLDTNRVQTANRTLSRCWSRQKNWFADVANASGLHRPRWINDTTK